MRDTYSEPSENSTEPTFPPRIIAAHFFGIDLPPDGASALTKPGNRACLQQLTNCLHDLGPRPVLEILYEICVARDIPIADLLERLGRYPRLDPSVVKALGGDRFPTLPLHEVV